MLNMCRGSFSILWLNLNLSKYILVLLTLMIWFDILKSISQLGHIKHQICYFCCVKKSIRPVLLVNNPVFFILNNMNNNNNRDSDFSPYFSRCDTYFFRIRVWLDCCSLTLGPETAAEIQLTWTQHLAVPRHWFSCQPGKNHVSIIQSSVEHLWLWDAVMLKKKLLTLFYRKYCDHSINITLRDSSYHCSTDRVSQPGAVDGNGPQLPLGWKPNMFLEFPAPVCPVLIPDLDWR